MGTIYPECGTTATYYHQVYEPTTVYKYGNIYSYTVMNNCALAAEPRRKGAVWAWLRGIGEVVRWKSGGIEPRGGVRTARMDLRVWSERMKRKEGGRVYCWAKRVKRA